MENNTTQTTKTIIVWFRRDLRIQDNPALYYASSIANILPIFIFDDEDKYHKIGSASKIWLYHSLQSLEKSLNHSLLYFKGSVLSILQNIIENNSIHAIYWNRCYEPWRIQQDTEIKKKLSQHITIKSFNGSLLWEPWNVLKKDKTPYRVFTHFYKNGCLQAVSPRAPLETPKNLHYVHKNKLILYSLTHKNLSLSELQLMPKKNWYIPLISHWNIGEYEAKKKLELFIKHSLSMYKKGRDFPTKKYTSYLSPHICWGEISPHQIWYSIPFNKENENIQHFRSELAWREFSYNLLYYFPELPWKNLQSKFDLFPWKKDKNTDEYKHQLSSWKRGNTGYPFIDAGMRELWNTGYMHNRVRMVVASFLVKNLCIHWHEGEKWFWDCLFDADMANNSASWQWVAGTGADAAPFFRIFNPILQATKFDPEGQYIRSFVPELSLLPNKYIANPWQAPESVLKEANITLGKDYPFPIVDISISRNYALECYKNLKAYSKHI